MNTQDITLLIIPGLNDSGPGHWQSYWLKRFANSQKVIQHEWDRPLLNDWVEKLNQYIEESNKPVILVAHSLAVSLVLHWTQKYDTKKVIGALLVSTSDVDSPQHTPNEVRNFAPMPLHKLPFPSVVVASENDDFVSVPRAKHFAQQWGSDFTLIGKRGHINSDSNLGYWEEGISILENLIDRIHQS